MTTTTPEIDIIKSELQLAAEIDRLRQQLTESRHARRLTPRPSERLDAALISRKEAYSKLQRLKAQRAEAQSDLASMNTRLDAGDETVSVEEILAAEKAIERFGKLLKPAKKAMDEAHRNVQPLIADEHLAHLAATGIEEITDVPVVICKMIEDAPEISPLIVVSQTKPTEGYGTIDCSGEVSLHVTGTEIDSDALAEVLESTGSEVVIDGSRIRFHSAHWPLPRLTQPSAAAFETYCNDLGRAWHGLICGAEEARRMREHGHHAARENDWTGLFKVTAADLAVEAGVATGTANVSLAAQYRSEDMPHDELRHELDRLVEIFREGSLGGRTAAGEIVSLDITDTSVGTLGAWDPSEVAHVMGMASYPRTLNATIRVEFRYEPVEF